MRVVIAPDSFKESLSASQVARAISKGVRNACPQADVICIPMADGGEGTVEALIMATSGYQVSAPSVDALNRPVDSFYGVLGDGLTAVVEMAAASGLELLLPEERNPMIATTFGTGLLIRAAIDAGFRKIIVGIGGSATNDGGAGMAQALGFRLLNENGSEIDPGGGSLGQIYRIDHSQVHPRLKEVEITIACDVQNPLLGISGATRVYGLQKGATAGMLEDLEQNMEHYARILHQEFGVDYANLPGAGAAGGLGAGLMAFCKARMNPGFALIAQLTNLEEHLSEATLALTGEGKIDSQTAFGKTISGLTCMAKKFNVPVVALAGMVTGDLDTLYDQGLTSAFAIANGPMDLQDSKKHAAKLLTDTTERVVRLFLKAQKK